MRTKALLLLAGQQICLLGGLAVCVALRPAGLAANDGISYYSGYADTFPFYMFSLLGTGLFSYLAARLLTKPELRPLRYGLSAFAVLVAAIAFTPFFVSIYVDLAHTLVSIFMFVVQLALSIWLLVRLRWSAWAIIFICLETIAGIVSVMYVLPSEGFLIQGQVAFQVAFAALLGYGFAKLLPA